MSRQRKKVRTKKGKPGDLTGKDRAKEDAPETFTRIEAADAACLVGELHLQKGNFEKAIEAFTRALDNHPTPDAYQGRAQAYRALAERDERIAQEHS